MIGLVATPPIPSFTPLGLTFDEPTHRYTLHGHPLISVTSALDAAGLVEQWGTEADRERGAQAHAAIALLNERGRYDEPDALAGFLHGYRAFLAESAFRIDASEERLADADLGAAGTLDLRGCFITDAVQAIDIIDVKTGCVPTTVGYQTAGYVRLLPFAVRRRCRRWVLHLRPDGTYRLIPLLKRTDESVFLAALVIARAKRGYL